MSEIQVATINDPDSDAEHFSIDQDTETELFSAWYVNKRGVVLEEVIEQVSYSEALCAVAERFDMSWHLR